MHRIILAIVGLMALSACANPPATVESGGAAPIRRGDILELTRALTIPAGDAAVYIQNGAAVQSGTHDPYYAWCRLVMKTLSPLPRRLSPAEFRVTDIQQEVEDVWLQPLRYAAVGTDLAGSATADDYITTFFLDSAQAPDVDRLVCAHWEDPTLSPEHLNARQIRDTLGELLRFHAP